ncbi:WD repeat-containing protein on Y chromosome isoform X1 [Anolis carolinensis]|uniref:WD repeat-containing protein on Y chromosome isoform X1 n=1 Tax=Anolis carolinensis TaxID=28377 RepID=UPI002F2B3E0F
MPLRRKIRPISASGKLETSTLSSLLNDLREAAATTDPLFRRAQTSLGAHRLQATSPVSEGQKEVPQLPEWLMKEMLKGQQRSHSIGLMENISESGSFRHRVDSSRSQWKRKIEEQVTLEQLQKIHAAFQELEINRYKSLDLENFKHIFKKCMGSQNVNDEQLEELFMKIDYSATGRIKWHDFCTYMHLEYAEQDRFSSRLKRVDFSLPAEIKEIPHGEPVLHICSLSDSTLITAREDGNISFWSPELKLKRSKMVFDNTHKRSKWLMDFTVMIPYNKLILATGDRELQLYESSNFEPYLQISNLEAIPLNVDYCYTGHDECLILYGDDQLNYYDSLKAVISSSSHEPTALVIGCVVGATNVEEQMKEVREPQKDSKTRKVQAILGAPSHRAEGGQTVFRIHKGVKTFAFSKKNNLIVTGGMDRIVRMWNPYMPGRPTGMLRSHMAPIVYVCVSEEDKIFSVSTDNTVKIWDVEDQTCLFTACSKNNGINGEITACHYIPGTRSLCVATDKLAVLHLRSRLPLDPCLAISHKKPVLCCKFNKVFRHVVSGSEDSVVKVWDLDSGKLLFEFSNAHDSSAITCLTFDPSGRRLVTGGRDGCLKIWNYNNGQCLKSLKREGKCNEICDCVYVEVNRNNYIIAVGWDRRINLFYDSTDSLQHFQKPQPHWQDDLNRGHKEDILCIAQCPPTFLATSSYDGEIIVWNMMSGRICHRFCTPVATEPVDTKNGSVTRVIFLKTRAMKFESASASLVSNGPQGYLHFWSLFGGDPLVASFSPTKEKALISSIAVTADNSYLYAADEDGYVYIHDIQDYALENPKETVPKYVNHWRAHVNLVLSLEVIDEDNILLSSSIDRTIRLWSLNGEYIGTFGQAEPWEIFTPASWKHPRVPYEILIDPQSMPTHPMLEDMSSDTQITDPDKKTKDVSAPKEARHNLKAFQVMVSDEDIKKEINKQLNTKTASRRLTYERSKLLNRKIHHGGLSTYHAINYYEIESFTGNCKKPDLSVLGTDIFSSSSQGEAEQ